LRIKNWGLIEAERFIILIQKATFDYTKWQKNLFEDMTIEEIYNRVVRKLQFLRELKFTTNYRLKTTKCYAFCATCKLSFA
jgi:hypothetical protein